MRTRTRWVREGVELLSSMRFAISLLTVLCIASVVGSVIQQNEPPGNYINQFGPFWAEVVAAADLSMVYSAWWFLLMLAFLVVSTSLCVARHTPKIIADLRDYKAHLREQSLQAFRHKGSGYTPEAPQAVQARVSERLAASGWRVRADVRAGGAGGSSGTMVAARRDAGHSLGYIATHSAIVLICVGGLLDGNLFVRAQMAWQGKSIYSGGGTVGDVGTAHRLDAGTSAFRANLRVPEGASAATAVINLRDGVVLQELPFDIALRKFSVDYYSTGMPRRFTSDIVIRDHDTGRLTPASVSVNHPVIHRGVAIYQSSFEDGGSPLRLQSIPLAAGSKPFVLEGRVGSTMPVPGGTNGGQPLTLELTGLRVINVENLSGRRKDLHNVGPSFSYKLRDSSGQALEYQNYMLPIELDGRRVFLLGVRHAPGQPYQYLRIPADDAGTMTGWLRLRHALADPLLRRQAAQRYAALALRADAPVPQAELASTASRLLDRFAGVDAAGASNRHASGLQAISDLVERDAPARRSEPVSEVLLRVLAGSLFELHNLARGNAGLAPLAFDGDTPAFMQEAVLALSDSFLYPAPLGLALTDFTQVQASVFQVARTPGKNVVYLGAVLLAIGVFAMLFVRERRLWVWLTPAPQGGTSMLFAMSMTKRVLDADSEFDRLKAMLLHDEHQAHAGTPPHQA